MTLAHLTGAYCAGRSPAPQAPAAAAGTMLSGPVFFNTVPSGLAPAATAQEYER
jgi:hypothetical protein